MLQESTFNDHIITDSAHTEMSQDPMSIAETVEHPDCIHVSSTNSDRDVYFAKGKHKDYPDEYVKVVVYFKTPTQGYVMSAWTQEEIKGGIGALKYEKTT